MPPLAQSTVRRAQCVPRPISTPLFLINLDAAGERRQHMLGQLSAQGLAAHRIGIDCRAMTRQQTVLCATRRFPDVAFAFDLLSGAEIGCWMSHLSAWASFLSSGSGSACAVIEDDVILETGFGPTIDAIATQRAYDVIYLGTSSRNVSARRRTSVDGVALHEPTGSVYNTWGYVIRREYLERLFAIRPLRLASPIDHVLGGRSAAMKPRTAVVQPMVVREEPGLGRKSQIEPYTWRIDRWRLVERSRRAFLESRLSHWYYALVNER